MRWLATDVSALPLWAAVLSLVTFNACYLVAVSLDHLPACVPYLSGCTSVSSTARMPPESLIFKVGMLPLAPIVLLTWWRLAAFLDDGLGTPRLPALRVLGIMAALSLLLYTLTLGIAGDEYRSLRRLGINGFALSTFVSQLIFVFSYRPMQTGATRTAWLWLVVICLAVPAVAIAGELAKWARLPRRPVNNVIAWNALLLQCLWYGLLSRLWYRHKIGNGFCAGTQG
jgi:hypothetical protein